MNDASKPTGKLAEDWDNWKLFASHCEEFAEPYQCPFCGNSDPVGELPPVRFIRGVIFDEVRNAEWHVDHVACSKCGLIRTFSNVVSYNPRR